MGGGDSSLTLCVQVCSKAEMFKKAVEADDTDWQPWAGSHYVDT